MRRANRVQWAMLVYALAIGASAWLVAATLGDGTPATARAATTRARAP